MKVSGLKTVRIQCNYTIMDIANKLGVSKQTISAWETGKKPIPEARKEELAGIFGLDKSFFEDIPEDKVMELISRARFRKIEKGNEFYTYNPDEGNDPSRIGYQMMYYEDIRDMTLTEELAHKKDEQRQLEAKIHDTFSGKKEYNIRDQMLFIDRGITLYSRFVDLINLFYDQSPLDKMLYYYRIVEMLDGMQQAMGRMVDLVSEDDIRGYGEIRKNVDDAEQLFKKNFDIAHKKANEVYVDFEDAMEEAVEKGLPFSVQYPPMEPELTERWVDARKSERRKKGGANGRRKR